MKGHCSYHACSFCRIVGEYNGRSVIFPFTCSQIEERDDTLYARGEESNQTGISPLVNLVSLKDAFPFEYMHLVCLGVMKRLVQSYFTTKHGLFRCHVTASMMSKLEENVCIFQNILPREFQRKVRSFKNHCYFKATEYRTLLLYTRPVFLKNILPHLYYQHFLLLHFSIYVFISPRFSHLHEHAKCCIDRFLYDLGGLFNSSAYTYNAHCLSHLYNFVKLLGPLDNFSSFPYENFLHSLNKRIKSGTFVLSQSVNSLLSMRTVLKESGQRSLYFSKDEPNNCAEVMMKSEDKSVYIMIDEVHDEDNGVYVSGRVFRFLSNVYSYPYASSIIGIGNFALTNKRVKNLKPINKCVVFPQNDFYTIIPFADPSAYQ